MTLVSRIMRRLRPPLEQNLPPSYERVCESHARASHDDEFAIGPGNFAVIGRTELDLLVEEGLQPAHTLVDLGCGIGRLAIHAIPYLDGGQYIGIDISDTFLAEVRRRLADLTAASRCRVEWVKQSTDQFALSDRSVDMFCAFSVFTHLEHEDSFRYLKSALRITKPGGKFVFSCLPIELPAAQDIFRTEASMNLATRWERLRNVVTSVELMSGIATMAGWNIERWRRAGEANIRRADGSMTTFGHSTCVLVAPR